MKNLIKFNGNLYLCTINKKVCRNCNCFEEYKKSEGGFCNYLSVRSIKDDKSVLILRDDESVEGGCERYELCEKIGDPHYIENSNIYVQDYKIPDNYEDNSISLEDRDDNTDIFYIYNHSTKIISIVTEQEPQPFNLEEAKQGKSICTVDGRSVRIICFDRKDCSYFEDIVALVESTDGRTEDILVYDRKGHNYATINNTKKRVPNNDLVIFKKKAKEMWINIRKSDLFNTEEEAKSKKNQENSDEKIKTIKIKLL